MLKRYLPLIAGLFAVVLTSSIASAGSTINFDDLPASKNTYPIRNGYNGFNWKNFYVLNGQNFIENFRFSQSGFFNGTVSRPNVIYNAGELPASFSKSTAFNLVGFDATAAWYNNLTISLTGLYNGNQKFTQNFMVNTNGPTFLTLNWSDITELRLKTSGGVSAGYGGCCTHVAIDNITYSTATVPGPIAGAGLPALLGVAGLVAWRRRRLCATTTESTDTENPPSTSISTRI